MYVPYSQKLFSSMKPVGQGKPHRFQRKARFEVNVM